MTQVFITHIGRIIKLGSVLWNTRYIGWGQYLLVTQVSEGGRVQQDQTDLEWFVWIPIMRAYAPFDLLHVMLAQTVRRFWPQVSEGGGGVRQDQTDLEWFVWIPIMRAYAPFDLLHVMLAQTVRRFWPQVDLHALERFVT
ncbi:hypothetical protein O3P69_008821 [Scylla paramamosain]|uniref:Uncharacterized protein n=1 Tax=Scylla paramamosain TaxID=85552 RepID=A0AAW0TSQ0_SCYPA